MAVLNIQAGRAWLGDLLKRKGPVSPTTWRRMVDQGMPVGCIAGSPFVSTEAVEAWLESRAGLPLASKPMPTLAGRRIAAAAPPRRRGRPKKFPA
jgi:hypothetical protein